MIRSVSIHEFGDANVLRIENVEVGEPRHGEVRVRVQGAFHPMVVRAFPFDPNADARRFMEAGEQVGKIVVTL